MVFGFLCSAKHRLSLLINDLMACSGISFNEFLGAVLQLVYLGNLVPENKHLCGSAVTHTLQNV